MNIVVCCIVALLVLLAGNCYVNYSNLTESEEPKSCNNLLAIKKIIIPGSKKQAVYFCLALLSTAGLAVVINFLMDGISLIPQVKMICLISIIVPIALIDYQKHIIPNVILLAGLVLRIILFIFEFIFMRQGFLDILKSSLIGAAVLGIFFTVCALLFKNSVGMGDVKLFIIMGLFQGISAAFASIFMSLIVCFIYSIILLATRKKSRKDSLAFAPCVLIGTYLSMALIGA